MGCGCRSLRPGLRLLPAVACSAAAPRPAARALAPPALVTPPPSLPSTIPPSRPIPPRGYPERKTRENVQCEIMGVVLEEARESYAEGAVHALPSNSVEEMEAHVERLAAWAAAWTPPAAPGQG